MDSRRYIHREVQVSFRKSTGAETVPRWTRQNFRRIGVDTRRQTERRKAAPCIDQAKWESSAHETFARLLAQRLQCCSTWGTYNHWCQPTQPLRQVFLQFTSSQVTSSAAKSDSPLAQSKYRITILFYQHLNQDDLDYYNQALTWFYKCTKEGCEFGAYHCWGTWLNLLDK